MRRHGGCPIVGLLVTYCGATAISVSTTGQDTNTCGSEQSPCQSLSFALNRLNGGGGVITLTPGRYTLASNTGVNVTGGQATTIQAASPNTVFITGSAVTSGWVLQDANLTVTNIVFAISTAPGMLFCLLCSHYLARSHLLTGANMHRLSVRFADRDQRRTSAVRWLRVCEQHRSEYVFVIPLNSIISCDVVCAANVCCANVNSRRRCRESRVGFRPVVVLFVHTKQCERCWYVSIAHVERSFVIFCGTARMNLQVAPCKCGAGL